MELNQLLEYTTFEDLGITDVTPHGYKKIYLHPVFDVKSDYRKKVRIVAGGTRLIPILIALMHLLFVCVD